MPLHPQGERGIGTRFYRNPAMRLGSGVGEPWIYCHHLTAFLQEGSAFPGQGLHRESCFQRGSAEPYYVLRIDDIRFPVMFLVVCNQITTGVMRQFTYAGMIISVIGGPESILEDSVGEFFLPVLDPARCEIYLVRHFAHFRKSRIDVGTGIV